MRYNAIVCSSRSQDTGFQLSSHRWSQAAARTNKKQTSHERKERVNKHTQNRERQGNKIVKADSVLLNISSLLLVF